MIHTHIQTHPSPFPPLPSSLTFLPPFLPYFPPLPPSLTFLPLSLPPFLPSSFKDCLKTRNCPKRFPHHHSTTLHLTSLRIPPLYITSYLPLTSLLISPLTLLLLSPSDITSYVFLTSLLISLCHHFLSPI